MYTLSTIKSKFHVTETNKTNTDYQTQIIRYKPDCHNLSLLVILSDKGIKPGLPKNPNRLKISQKPTLPVPHPFVYPFFDPFLSINTLSTGTMLSTTYLNTNRTIRDNGALGLAANLSILYHQKPPSQFWSSILRQKIQPNTRALSSVSRLVPVAQNYSFFS